MRMDRLTTKFQMALADAQKWDEIVAMVAEAVAEAQPGELIRGRGWHQEKWDPPADPEVGGFPVHDLLSEVSPDNPVLLTHASGHATFANARAMELSGITRDTTQPRGRRDSPGRPRQRDWRVQRDGRAVAARGTGQVRPPPSPRRQAELAVEERTIVLFESPRRLAATLADLAGAFGSERQVAVAREVTKLHEEVWRGSLSEASDWAATPVKGEIVLVVGGAPPAAGADDDRIRVLLAEARGTGASTRDAADEVARRLGVSRRRAYRLALEIPAS